MFTTNDVSDAQKLHLIEVHLKTINYKDPCHEFQYSDIAFEISLQDKQVEPYKQFDSAGKVLFTQCTSLPVAAFRNKPIVILKN